MLCVLETFECVRTLTSVGDETDTFVSHRQSYVSHDFEQVRFTDLQSRRNMSPRHSRFSFHVFVANDFQYAPTAVGQQMPELCQLFQSDLLCCCRVEIGRRRLIDILVQSFACQMHEILKHLCESARTAY